MDSGDVIQLLLILVLIGASSFFASAEAALTAVNKIKIKSLSESGDKRAARLIKILDCQENLLDVILVGNVIVRLAASAMTVMFVLKVWGSGAVGIAMAVLGVLLLVCGELTPKTVAAFRAEKTALSFGRMIRLCMVLIMPAVKLLHILSDALLRLSGIDPHKKRESITEDELRTIVEVSHEEGVIEAEEKKMINNVFDFGDSVVKDIMTPRIDVSVIDVKASYEELFSQFREEKYTRMPVYEDRSDNVIGVINMKDFLLAKDHEEFSISDYLREPLYTYENKKTAELMVEMRQTLNNVVIVLDEYGAMAGLITLEDILEEIVGEIRDEYDEDEEDELIQLSQGEYLVEGAVKLDDLNERLGLSLESEDYDSIGGLVLEQLDRLPEEGEEINCNGVRLVVERVEKNRIDKVHIYRELPPEVEE